MEMEDYSVVLQKAYNRIKEIDVQVARMGKERSDLENAMRDAVRGIVGESLEVNEYDDEGVDVSVYPV